MRFILLLLAWIPRPALAEPQAIGAHAPLDIAGEVIAGPCPKAFTLRSDDGKRYELDAGRVSVRAGQRVQAKGVLYPRVSLCRVHPWLDLRMGATHGTDTRAARPAQATTANTDATTTVTLVSALDQLGSTLEAGQRLRAVLAPSVRMVIGVAANQRALLPKLYQVTRGNWQLMEGLEVHAVASTNDKYILRTHDSDRAFVSQRELLAALKDHGLTRD
jgi:hypothetical protein